MKLPKRPRDVSQRAKLIVDIATGEVENDSFGGKSFDESEARSLGGHKGGIARANKLSATKRSEIASRAAKKRWAAKK